MTLQIRPFAEGDEAQVVDLWARCGLLRPWNDPRKDIARKLRVQRELFLVGVAGDRIAATVMAGYEGHRGWINYLAVDPDQRRGGLGRAIMAEAERLLAEVGCPKINLQVRSTNAKVIECYRAIGYGTDDVVSMGKRLKNDDPAARQ